jgi:hypothetical protein
MAPQQAVQLRGMTGVLQPQQRFDVQLPRPFAAQSPPGPDLSEGRGRLPVQSVALHHYATKPLRELRDHGVELR